ncbi:poly [ADP-ribose] polymerase tankyrase-2-like [Branchiostoma floridae]|uniref:Poly [ADP-ribose] polymerase tankyrase-2-like n=1 Tax=Branchiostoma floridae TaxID=7739 RepID=A0A9J7HRY6_BRAFL|nr:poly [ADP-ribose] polymerase tankyrase-2-like [Branchiostoma floridae]
MAETYSDVNELLLHAAREGSVEGVEMTLKEGADIDYDRVNSEVFSSGTALFLASNRGHVDVVRLLLRKGASVVKRSKSTFAPLHTAAHNGNTEVVDLLVQHGATLEIKDGFQYTPLMTACIYNHVDTVKRLIELGARPDLPDSYIDDMRGNLSTESMQLVQEARKSKLLRCCNPTCGKPGYRSTLKLCARCKLTRYCSRDCQKQHWSVGHKKCCGHDAYTNEGPNPFSKFLKSMADDLIEQALARAK